MAPNNKSDEADRLAREPARRGMARRLMMIGERYAALPILDDRGEDEILGYDHMLSHGSGKAVRLPA